MGSRKPSAKAKRVQEFKSQLGSYDSLFSAERRREQRLSAERKAAHRRKSCESKNRYSSLGEAQVVISECEARGKRGLSAYRCPHCNGWHLTSHPWD